MKSFLDYLNEEKTKLIGNQNKLDMDGDNKITKKDFDILNNKKKNVKKEYVNNQGNLIEKPQEKTVADYEGPDAKTPPGEQKSAPYKPANDNTKSPTIEVEKNGLGELGDKKLKYEPNTNGKEEIIKSETKTEQFLSKTKNMSVADFTKYMLDECGCGEVNDEQLPYVTAYKTGKFQPHPTETIKYIIELANKNENVLEKVIYEMKSSKLLNKVLESLLEHSETYDVLTSLLSEEQKGPERCKLLAKSMNSSVESYLEGQSIKESVSSPIGFEDEMGEEMDDMENMDDEDMDDEDMDDEDMEDEDMDDEDMEDEDMEDEDMEDEDMEDEDMDMEDEEDMEDMGDEDMDMEDMEDMGDEDMDMEDEEDMGDEDMSYNNEPNYSNKKFAHNNLLNAMRRFNSMKDSM